MSWYLCSLFIVTAILSFTISRKTRLEMCDYCILVACLWGITSWMTCVHDALDMSSNIFVARKSRTRFSFFVNTAAHYRSRELITPSLMFACHRDIFANIIVQSWSRSHEYGVLQSQAMWFTPGNDDARKSKIGLDAWRRSLCTH